MNGECDRLVNALDHVAGMLSRRGSKVTMSVLDRLAFTLRMSGLDVTRDADEARTGLHCDNYGDHRDESFESENESEPDTEMDMARLPVNEPVAVVDAYKLILSIKKLHQAIRFDLLALLRATYRNAMSDGTSFMLVRASRLDRSSPFTSVMF